MKQRKSTEDYLKTIYILESQQGVHGSDVARMLKVTRPTVSIALKALEQEGYVWMDESRLVHLTDSGLQIAKDTYERHQFFQGFLTGLGINPEIAAHDACEIVIVKIFGWINAAAHQKHITDAVLQYLPVFHLDIQVVQFL